MSFNVLTHIRRLYTATTACFGTFIASFNSAIFAAAAAHAGVDFSAGREVIALGTSLFVLGFASGPLIWAPSSEIIGRRWPLCIGMFGSSVFGIGCATAANVQTLVVCRFFAGLFGASPLCVAPAVLADLYSGAQRGIAISIYALTVFGGPFMAPVVGSYSAASYLGWRLTLYLPAILGFVDFVFLLASKETFAAVALIGKAKELRRQTGNWAIHADHERLELSIDVMVRKYLTRPLRMLTTEPIVLLVSLYMSFIYGLVYALLGAYPYVFKHTYGMSTRSSTLPFLGLFLGILLALALILGQQKRYTRLQKENDGDFVPEWRLAPAILGAVVFTVGLFWCVMTLCVLTQANARVGSHGQVSPTQSTGWSPRQPACSSDLEFSVSSYHASTTSLTLSCPCK